MPTTATITGTMLVPGVSLNRRLYTKDLIERAVTRMKERIADPAGLPISMRTHHDAADDSLRIVGRVTDVHVDQPTGEARYAAVLNTSTQAGHDMWQLIKDRRQPLLDSTSIYGWWLGEVRQIDHDGETVDAGDDLEVDAIDFTASPGVTGARIRTVSTEQRAGTESARGRHIVTETITAQAITEKAPPPGDTHTLLEDGTGCATCLETPTVPKSKRGKGLTGKSGVKYADPGYQPDGKQRYELDTPSHIRAAWSYINQADNQKPYTAQQVTAIKGRIKAAAKKAGIDISSDQKENATVTRSDILTEDTRLGAVTEWIGAANCCGFSISAFNGPLTVSISAYDGIDAVDLPLIAKAAMDAACQAIRALDPDGDGDVDKPGDENGTSEGDSKTPSDVAGDTAGDTVSPDDDMESRTYSVQATAEGPVTINITPPNPRVVAAAIARRKSKTPSAAETTEPAAPAQTPPSTAPGPDLPATAPAGAPADNAHAADSSATDQEKEQNMPDQKTAPEETNAPPALNEDAIKLFADALGPVIGAAVESAITKTRESANPAAPATETKTDGATDGTKNDVAAYADAVKTAFDGLPGALAEAIKPLMCQCSTAAAGETATDPAKGTTTTTTATAPAAESAPAAAAVDPKDVALQAAKMAIPELLEAFGVPKRKGLVTSSEHRAKTDKTPEELWNSRGELWDQLIPAAPAAVQPSPAALTPAGAAAPAV